MSASTPRWVASKASGLDSLQADDLVACQSNSQTIAGMHNAKARDAAFNRSHATGAQVSDEVRMPRVDLATHHEREDDSDRGDDDACTACVSFSVLDAVRSDPNGSCLDDGSRPCPSASHAR